MIDPITSFREELLRCGAMVTALRHDDEDAVQQLLDEGNLDTLCIASAHLLWGITLAVSIALGQDPDEMWRGLLLIAQTESNDRPSKD